MATYGRSVNTNININPYSGGGSDVKVELHGQWVTLNKLFRYLSTSPGGQGVKRDIAKASRDFTTNLKKALILGMDSNGAAIGASWDPHSDKYTAWIERKGYTSQGLLKLTGHYARAIRNAKIKAQSYQITLTLERGDLVQKSHPKGISLGQYAVIHEVGSVARMIPARPLWQPAFTHIGGERRLLQHIMGGVGKRMNKMGIGFGGQTQAMGIGFMDI